MFRSSFISTGENKDMHFLVEQEPTCKHPSFFDSSLCLPHLTHPRDQSGYRLPLGLETVPLVHRLFADLIALGKGANEVRLCPTKIVCCGEKNLVQSF
jgi:hypothetical protein